MNDRSDLAAKKAFRIYLLRNGYKEVRANGGKSDFVAEKEGISHYFEIKTTRQTITYFGAATLTEWECALESPGRYWFVLARKQGGNWTFKPYAPEEFMRFSYVPPFKIFFNVPLERERNASRRRSITPELLEYLVRTYRRLRSMHRR